METAQHQTRARGHGSASKTRDAKRALAMGILALVAIWLVAFIVSNSETVRVSFVFGHVKLSLIWVMIICAVLGAVLTWAVPRCSRGSADTSR